jgi:type IV pilus assembly protein PilB
MLKRVAGISDLDIEEILQEQSTAHQRFGEIALSMNLCSQPDVWRAWFMQLGGVTPHIDLRDFGIDSQALGQVPRNIALQYQMLPLRVNGGQIVAAIAEDAPTPPATEIEMRLKKEIRFVHASRPQIEAALAKHYGPARTFV